MLSVTQGARYSDDQRREAIAYYVVTGSVKKVHEYTGVPERTLREWRMTEWWQTAIADYRRDNSEEIDARITGHLLKALDHIDDRLDNGDYRVIKDKVARVPMSGKDLATTAAILFDKRQILRAQPTSITQSSTVADMRKQFEAMMVERYGKTIEGERVTQTDTYEDTGDSTGSTWNSDEDVDDWV